MREKNNNIWTNHKKNQQNYGTHQIPLSNNSMLDDNYEQNKFGIIILGEKCWLLPPYIYLTFCSITISLTAKKIFFVNIIFLIYNFISYIILFLPFETWLHKVHVGLEHVMEPKRAFCLHFPHVCHHTWFMVLRMEPRVLHAWWASTVLTTYISNPTVFFNFSTHFLLLSITAIHCSDAIFV